MLTDNEEAKQRIELKLTRVQYVLAILALVHIVAFVLGAFLGFLYLIRYNFNPGGISGADTLAMVMWSLGFLIATAIGFGVSAIAAFPIGRSVSWLVCRFETTLEWMSRGHVSSRSALHWKLLHGTPKKLAWRKDQEVFFVLGCIVLLLFGALIYKSPFDVKAFFVTLLAGGMFLSLNVFATFIESYNDWPRKADPTELDRRLNRLSPAKRTAVITAVLIVSFISLQIGMWLDTSALIIGFREQDASIRLNKDDFESLVEQATRSGVAVNPCEQILPGSFTVHHVDILWHNIGARSLLRVPSRRLGSSSDVENSITFKTANNAIIDVANAVAPVRCSEFLVDAVFQEDREHVKPEARAYIIDKLRPAVDAAGDAEFRVVGHRGSGATAVSVELSRRQVSAVKALIVQTFKLPESSVQIVASDQQVTKRECDSASAVQRSFCEQLNRRIEVHVLK